MKFSTQDVDYDGSSSNCAQAFHGAWWFRACFDAHLNGEYLKGRHGLGSSKGIIWRHYNGWGYSYKVAEMKVGSHKN